MKFFRVQIAKIKGYHYIRLPKIIADKMKLDNCDEIEISIREDANDSQTTLWDQQVHEIKKVCFTVPADTLTMNMYSRLYVPADYRFFFPPSLNDFILETNAGNIQTHLTTEGNIIKGMKSWFLINHPIESNDTFTFEKPNDRHARYRLTFDKGNK